MLQAVVVTTEGCRQLLGAKADQMPLTSHQIPRGNTEKEDTFSTGATTVTDAYPAAFPS
jgi:hypothetical protein